jgi:hypothetical protein
MDERMKHIENGDTSILNILKRQEAANIAAAKTPPRTAVPTGAQQESQQQGTYFSVCLKKNKCIFSRIFYFIFPFLDSPPLPPQATINETLRATPRLPAIDARMPKSVALCLTKWQNRGLDAFRNVQFHNAGALVQAFF